MRIFHALHSKTGTGHRSERRRAGSRLRTRLRPGKLLDARLGFLADCAIVERSADGVRVRCFGEWSDAEDGSVAVFDENDGRVRTGRVAWRNRAEAGISLDAGSAAVDPGTLRRIAGPYYAVAD